MDNTEERVRHTLGYLSMTALVGVTDNGTGVNKQITINYER